MLSVWIICSHVCFHLYTSIYESTCFSIKHVIFLMLLSCCLINIIGFTFDHSSFEYFLAIIFILCLHLIIKFMYIKVVLSHYPIFCCLLCSPKQYLEKNCLTFCSVFFWIFSVHIKVNMFFFSSYNSWTDPSSVCLYAIGFICLMYYILDISPWKQIKLYFFVLVYWSGSLGVDKWDVWGCRDKC